MTILQPPQERYTPAPYMRSMQSCALILFMCDTLVSKYVTFATRTRIPQACNASLQDNGTFPDKSGDIR